MFTVDGRNYAYPLLVKDQAPMSDIFRTDALADVYGRQTAFEFDSKQVHLNTSGKFAAVVLPAPEKVTWILRRGSEVRWRSITEAKPFSIVELPFAGIEPGIYQLEAVTANEARTTAYIVSKELPRSPMAPCFRSTPTWRRPCDTHLWPTSG